MKAGYVSAAVGVIAAVTVAVIGVSASTIRPDAQGPTVAPGSRTVAGAALEAHEASWHQRLPGEDGWTARGTVTEHLETITEGGVERWRRRQIASLGPVRFVNDTIVDKATLAAVRFERRLESDSAIDAELEERLAAAGQIYPYTVEFDGREFRKRIGAEGDVKTETGTLMQDGFDGSVLGLVVAALPLTDEYRATMPVTFLNPGDASLTFYNVVATVVGRETVEAGGRSFATWKVDIEWLDPGTGGVMSAGGEDQAGGAYWIADGAGGSTPHVLKYRNESVDFELVDGGLRSVAR